MAPLDAVLRRGIADGFKLRVAGQHLIMDAADPVLARPDLAVRHGLQRPAERAAELAEHFLRSVEGDAADQKDVLLHAGAPNGSASVAGSPTGVPGRVFKNAPRPRFEHTHQFPP